MKFTKENLKDFKYNEKTGKWYKGNNTYIKKNACKICGESYLTRLNTIGDFCDRKCWSENNIKNLKNKRFGRLVAIELLEKNKWGSYIWKCKCDCGNEKDVVVGNLVNKHTRSCGCLNKEIIGKRSKGENSIFWKGGVSKSDIPLYNTYASQIEYAEKVRRSPEDENILQVKCKYCNKWHIPTIRDVWSRRNALNGSGSGECNFYCSPECKKECPIYGKIKYSAEENNSKKYSREVQPELRQMVFERDNWTCQNTKCKSTKSLHCHHLEGIRYEPLESADIDKCVTLCKKCHKEAHKKEGCNTLDMKCKE